MLKVEISFIDWEKRRGELLEAQAELGDLPMAIENIIEIEQMGYAVDLVSGAIVPDDSTFTLTIGGHAMAVVIGTGFLDEGGQP